MPQSVGRRVTSVAEMAENEELMMNEDEEEDQHHQHHHHAHLEAGEDPVAIPEVPMPQEVTDGVDGYFCKHYKRKCMFVTPCCNGLYRCRFCHDEAEDHTLTREDVVTIECCDCKHRQGVNESCEKCGLRFGKYFCFDCKLYDDEDKQQFHCTGCGICRVGGRENYFHCNTCDMCLPNHLYQAHKCVEKVSRSNCPVCLEDIHTSRIPSQIPPCNHLIHKTCFDDMLKSGHYACPVCGQSMMDMSDVWKIYDREILETPMPREYQNMACAIQCRDCLKEGLGKFHILGVKCEECGSYNTTRVKGPLLRRGRGRGPLIPPHLVVDSSDEEEEEMPAARPSARFGHLGVRPYRPGRASGQGVRLPRSAVTEEISTSTTMDTDSNMDTSSVSMTPEPSPLREDMASSSSLSSFSSPSSPSSSVVRRLEFSEDEGSGGS